MTASSAASAATAVLLFLVLNRSCGSTRDREEEDEAERERQESAERDRALAEREEKERRRRRRKVLRRPVWPPGTWGETMTMLRRTLRFAHKQTFGQWSVGDLICGVRYNMCLEGNLEVASVYAGSNSVELQGPGILAELTRLLRLLTLCFSFTKDTFRVFVKSGGFTKEDIILKQLKAAFLKPPFTVLRDRNSKSFLVFIRGARSVKDKMTASYGPLVPFHHIILEEGNVSKVILGYAHCGMVVAARWAAMYAIPYLRKALTEHPEYDIKIIGHSMGAGIAALLTFILREQREFASTTCIAFGPACCMTWDLAESANHFITSIVNATDVVPTLEAVTVRNLRAEVGASSWIEQTRFLNAIHRTMISVKSLLPSSSSSSSSSSSTRTRVRGANKFLKPVSHSTKAVIKHVQNAAKAVVKSGSSLTARSQRARKNLDNEITPGSVIASDSSSIVREWFSKKSVLDKLVRNSRVSDDEEIDEKINRVLAAASVEQMTEVQFWYMLEKELQRQDEDVLALKEVAAAAEIKEDKAIILQEEFVENELPLLPNGEDELQFWPPGRMLHIVATPALDHKTGKDDLRDPSIGIYEVPRKMYGKIHLSQTMIKDHYMDRYEMIIKLLVDKLKKENNGSDTVVI